MDLADCSSKQKDKHNFAVKSTCPTIVLDHRYHVFKGAHALREIYDDTVNLEILATILYLQFCKICQGFSPLERVFLFKVTVSACGCKSATNNLHQFFSFPKSPKFKAANFLSLRYSDFNLTLGSLSYLI